MNREFCRGLYQKYSDLKEKTTPKLYEWESKKDMKVQIINTQEVEELNKTIKELENCLDFLTDKELINISEDDGFREKVNEILRKRKGF